MPPMSTTEQVITLVAQLGGLAILAGTLAALTAFISRWSLREAGSHGLSLLVGVSAVAVYLNTTTALGQVVSDGAPTSVETALFNIAAFAVAGGGGVLGHRAGDRFGTEVVLDSGIDDSRQQISQLIRSVGRVVAVDLPEEIDDVIGYDPVSQQTKDDLAGKRFLFPRRLTVEELRARLVSRLKSDYGVGHVDIELAANGRVEHLAVGSRAAGIGPTLPPATNAVAIKADPAFAASAGDLVQVWETDPLRRILTAELRGVTEETATIAIDAAHTPKLDPRKEYRLVTLPVTDRPDREFASLLRAADETFSSVTVEAGSPLHGMPVGGLDLTIVSVQPESAERVSLPGPTYVLAPGDTVFVVARPPALRHLEAAAEPLDPSLVQDIGEPQTPRDRPSPPSESTQRAPEPVGTAEPTEQPAQESVESDGTPADQRPAESTQEQSAQADAGTKQEQDSPQVSQEGDTAEADIPTEPSVDEKPEDSATESTANTERETDTDDDTATAAAEDDDETGSSASASSFQALKDEFESGDADWAGDDSLSQSGGSADETEPERQDNQQTDTEYGETDTQSEASDDGPTFEDSLDGISIDEDADHSSTEETEVDETGLEELGDSDGLIDLGGDTGEDDDLGALGDTGEDDDLSALSFDEDDEDEELSFDEETTGEGEDDNEDEEDDDDDEDEDGDDEDGGGGSSFQQLKEEFESGDADWADDIGSPGGDMRLDE